MLHLTIHFWYSLKKKTEQIRYCTKGLGPWRSLGDTTIELVFTEGEGLHIHKPD